MADLGTDVSTFPDLDMSFALISGPRVVAEAIARRLGTPRGGGLFYDPTYGYDLRGYLNEAVPASQLGNIAAAVEQEALRDERVESCTANVTLTKGVLKVIVRFVTADGPFAFTLTIDQATTSVVFGKQT